MTLHWSKIVLTGMIGLRAEVKALRDANKALSLYIAKIVERVIAHEGFEKV